MTDQLCFWHTISILFRLLTGWHQMINSVLRCLICTMFIIIFSWRIMWTFRCIFIASPWPTTTSRRASRMFFRGRFSCSRRFCFYTTRVLINTLYWFTGLYIIFIKINVVKEKKNQNQQKVIKYKLLFVCIIFFFWQKKCLKNLAFKNGGGFQLKKNCNHFYFIAWNTNNKVIWKEKIKQ